MRNWLYNLCCFSESPPPTPRPGDGQCLPFWVPYGRYCYYVYDGKEGFSWPDSQHYCQSHRTELVSIHERADVEFIRNMNYTKYHHIWIGLTRDNNCECRNGQENSHSNVVFYLYLTFEIHMKYLDMCFYIWFSSRLGLDRQDRCGFPQLGSRRAKCSFPPRPSGRRELCGDVPRWTLEWQQLHAEERFCMPPPSV